MSLNFRDFILIAHRGYSNFIPENTILAFDLDRKNK
jgi:glycerophosphoryl diester phosphodiesterase